MGIEECVPVITDEVITKRQIHRNILVVPDEEEEQEEEIVMPDVMEEQECIPEDIEHKTTVTREVQRRPVNITSTNRIVEEKLAIEECVPVVTDEVVTKRQ